MTTVNELPSQARPVGRAIYNWCTENGVDCEFAGLNGNGHQKVLLRYGQELRKTSFASTPSDKRRAAMNAVSQTRRIAREMGWKGKETPMRMAKQGLSKFDAQTPSTGAASECKVTRIAPVECRGVVIPMMPDGYSAGRDGESANAREARNLAMVQAREAGARPKEIHAALEMAGWDVPYTSVSPFINQTRIKLGLAPPPRPGVSAKKPAKSDNAKPFVEALAEAIGPAVEKIIADEVERRTADKMAEWEAVKSLIMGK